MDLVVKLHNFDTIGIYRELLEPRPDLNEDNRGILTWAGRYVKYIIIDVEDTKF